MKCALLSIVFVLIGCRSGSVPAAETNIPECDASKFVAESMQTLWIETEKCVITVPVDQSYKTEYPHTVRMLVLSMASNPGSVFAWDQVVTITDPSGTLLVSQQQQYDKRAGMSEHKEGKYPYPVALKIPARSVVRITRRAEATSHCFQGGKFDGRLGCFTSGSIQLEDSEP
jgi:hypothetical protein